MEPSTSPPPTPGAMLGGRYRLDARVASGGMASVWEAYDEVLARKVAVKVLHPHLAADDQFVARFKREALAAARLTHPSIVAIYDTCAQAGTEAIVMELVRGTTLRAELDRRGRFPPAEAAHVVAEICDALAHAHAAGIVHRDVKPANVLLSQDGRVLVADFGIAKAADGMDLTNTATTLGTAKYLAPEQVDPGLGPVDARADVYAAGVILYELLTGTPPFVADSEAGTALARLHRDPEPPNVDPAVDAVALRAMARDPASRFASATDLRDALRAAARGTPPTPAPHAPHAVGDATAALSVDRTTAVASARRPAPTAPPAKPKPKRRWAPAVMGAIVVVALAVAGGLWASTQDGTTGGGTGSGGPPAVEGGGLAIGSVRSFDPQSNDGVENDDKVGFVTDRAPDTSWRTSCYSRADLGGLKDGVGLVVELTEPSPVRELRVDSPVTGWTAEVYIAAEAAGDLAGWGAAVATGTAAGTTTTFNLDNREGGAVLLWITGLVENPDCSNFPFGVSVSELVVL